MSTTSQYVNVTGDFSFLDQENQSDNLTDQKKETRNIKVLFLIANMMFIFANIYLQQGLHTIAAIVLLALLCWFLYKPLRKKAHELSEESRYKPGGVTPLFVGFLLACGPASILGIFLAQIGVHPLNVVILAVMHGFLTFFPMGYVISQIIFFKMIWRDEEPCEEEVE